MAFADRLKTLFRKPAAPQDASADSPAAAAPEAVAAADAPDALVSRFAALPQAADATPAQPAPAVSAQPPADAALAGADRVRLPLLGAQPAAQHQRVLSILLGVGLIALGTLAVFGLGQTNEAAVQLDATGQALTHSQRLAKSVNQALAGDAKAFADVAESAKVLSGAVRGLKTGANGITPLDATHSPRIEPLLPMVERSEKAVAVVQAQKAVLTQVNEALRKINRMSADLLDQAEAVSSTKLQQNAPAVEIAAAGQLVMLTQRIGKSSNEFLTSEGVSPEAVFLLGKDLNTFKETAGALLEGSADGRIKPSTDPTQRELLSGLLKSFETTRTQAEAILGNLQGLAAAREAQKSVLADSESLRRELEALRAALGVDAGLGAPMLAGIALALALVVGAALGLAQVALQASRLRETQAAQERAAAQNQEQDAKRINDANQAAILRLMNELQSVAEGDLTQQATVTEDITGAIADSVNYTVEELRALVGHVQGTADQVAQTTSNVDATSTELLAASNEQLLEIRETGRSVLDMATRINDVSAQAQTSAEVAQQSRQAAEQGLQAVQNAIGGMNALRDQIQDTAKRIKRLGESSQEIGEMTELISDITEQTNVLALNAAIQAASAGEAGRGFSVVAEEVQRLAERSADATRQIAALVKAIQTDTQDAVAAMERSTQGVVENARLSDNAGTALQQIDQVSRRLAELIEAISQQTEREAGMANDVAGNIQHIFAVTEQTAEGTRNTATQVRELSKMAQELRQSVARFRIA